MDFTKEEQKILLQALYRFRGDVSGASQSEQNKYALVEAVIGKIEREAGPLSPERTRFDREMEENLSVLARGGEWPPRREFDKQESPPKVKPKGNALKASTSKSKPEKKKEAKSGAKPRSTKADPKSVRAKNAGGKSDRAKSAAKR